VRHRDQNREQDLQSHISNPRRSSETGHKSRHIAQLSNIPLLGRSILVSRIQRIAQKLDGRTKYTRLTAFLQFWNWLVLYLRNIYKRKHRYQSYPANETGIFQIAAHDNGPIRIALTADWGTGTQEAEAVAVNIESNRPHYTLHLGDVYFTGEGDEIAENCFGQASNTHKGVTWPLGTQGSFALMGNHEMYSGGDGYFKRLIPKLGLFAADKSITNPQSAGFFCLESEHWIILGLDTGYHSGGVPPLTNIPLINRIPWLNVDARFDEQMMTWLRNTTAILDRSESRKPVIVLTHHQPTSAFEKPFLKPAQQLASLDFFRNREFLWIYGHEHRFTVYEKQTIAESLQVYPRCIGHGGMPVDVSKLITPHPEVLFYDPRSHPIDKDHPKTRVGYNGHVIATLDGEKLTLDYHDILSNNLLLKETFTPTNNGKLKYESHQPPKSLLTSGA
jgi:hypothetical protein